MLATKTLPQLNFKQRTLIAIAVNVTNQLAPIESTSIGISRIKDYQIWRDCQNVAVVNTKTQQLIVFSTATSQFNQLAQEDIVSQGLWKNMHHYYGRFSPVISIEEIDLAWQFLRPLDPTIQNLYQIQQRPKEDRLYVPRKVAKKKPKVSKKPFLNCCRFFSRPKSNPNLVTDYL